MPELVGLGVQRPDTFGRLSQLLGIQGQQAEVKSAQQSQKQRAALAQFAASGGFDKHLGEDGTPDINAMMADPELQAAAGDQIQDVLGKVVALKQGMLQNMGTLVNLRGSQREAFSELMNGLRGDPDVANDNETGRQKVNQAMVQYGEMYGEDAYPVLQAYSRQIQSTPKGKLVDALKIVGMQAQAVGNQMAAQQPAYQGTGGQFVQVNPNALPTSAPSMPATIAPGFDTVTDPRTGNPYTVDRQTRRVSDLGAAPSSAPSSIPAPMKPGELETTKAQAAAVSERVASGQQKANDSPQAVDALSRARELLDTGISTGVPFEKFTSLKNLFAGMGFEAGTDANSLVKNLARYQAARANSIGLGGTDAARELAEKGSPNTKIDAKALQGVVTQSLATELALQGYAKVTGGITDPRELVKRENDFRGVPNLIQSYEYGLSRTPKEATEFLKKHGISAEEMKKSRARLREIGAL